MQTTINAAVATVQEHALAIAELSNTVKQQAVTIETLFKQLMMKSIENNSQIIKQGDWSYASDLQRCLRW